MSAPDYVYKAWLAQGQNAELDKFAVTRVAFDAGYLMQPAKPSLVIPPLDEHLREILGRICYQCIHIANIHRKAGTVIRERAEDEQAVVLHWLLTKYAQHGDDWRVKAEEELAAIVDKQMRGVQ